MQIKKKYLMLYIGLLLTSIFGLLLIGDKNLDLDEVVSVAISRDLLTMIKVLWNFEGNMWLYYIALHFWAKIDTSEAFIRSFSVIWAVATIFPLYFLARNLLKNGAANILMILFPLNVFFIRNAQFARSYSLLLFFTTLSSYLLIKLTNRTTRLYFFLYVLVSILSIYTHLYAILVLGAHFLYILYLNNKNQLKWFIVAGLLINISLLPLFLSPAMKSGQISWINAPDIYTMGATYVLLTGDFLFLSVVSLVIFFLFIFQKKHNFISSPNYFFLLILIIFPILSSLIFSFLIKPIFTPQYFTICLVPISILLAGALTSLKNKIVFKILLCILLLGSMVRLYFWYGSINTRPKLFTLSNKTPEWKSVTKYIASNSKNNDAVIAFPPYTQIVFDYYNQQQNIKSRIKSVQLEPLRLITGRQSHFDSKLLNSFPNNTNRVWYLYNERGKQSKEKQQIIEVLNNNYKKAQQINYYQLTVTLYKK